MDVEQIGGFDVENAMVMPNEYTDMSETEMNYDGGWSWKTFVGILGVAAAVGTAVTLGGYLITESAKWGVAAICTGLTAGALGEAYNEM